MVFLRKSFLIFSAFLLISPPVDALNLDDFGEKENISSTGVVVDISEPVIESISIEEYQENEGVVLSVKGKNFIPPHGKAVLLFPNDTGGTTSVTSFLYESPTHLVFPIPKNPSSGNVYVEAQETKGEKQKKQSNAFYFEFHPPEILFITGENGIAPGKDIRIWGKNLDGVYYQKGGRSYVVEDVSTGQLTGGFSKKAEEGLSYIDVTLPEENFNKKFWVERGCDRDGKNCLKSNKIQLTNTFPPVLTEYQLNFQTRIVTAYGKYLPEEAKDLSLSYEGKTLSIIDYDGTEGKFSFQLPCPMSGRGTLKVRSGGIWSNPLFISTPDVPELFGLSVEYSFHDGYRKVNVSARGDLLNVPTSTVCSEDAILYLGNTGFPLEKFGGAYFNDMLDDSYIPSSGEASVVFRGIRSEKIPFEKESFSVKPYIYQVESKYGFRPGAPFQIFGRNLGNKYKSCDQGSTIFTGPKIYSEERTKDGDCVPIRPMVSDSRIDAQFAPLEYGEYSSSSKKTTVSVSVGGKKSNEVDILFGMNEQKVSYAKPIITSVEYPEGHLPGSQVILRGGGFGIKTIYNIISFAGKAITPESTNSRGTELSFRIPEGAFSGKLVVTRKTPDEQQSEGVDILVSPHEEKKVLFSFAGEGKESVIEVDGAEETVQFANISVMNSISDIAVRRMRFDFSFTDGDPDHSLSYKSLKVLPFGTFTLKHNKKAVSSPIVATSAGNGHFFLDFPEFTLPLTEGDSDTISIETTILPFVTDKSAFSLSFDPDNPSRVSLYSEELGQGIALSPQETIALPSFSVSQSDTKTCIDTLSDNSHCEQYESLKKRNTSWQEKVQQEKQEQKKYGKANHERASRKRYKRGNSKKTASCR
ncbi:hypothetical protein IPN35_01915 [Candidatus Peregrinibacteria bacterium]|nr:MAG: hypothetical protein IPN35_01915 [Candidatus Peregrinibacteria bacterium]